MKHYDYIFAGAGLSALMSVYKMVLSGKFEDKNILLIDQDAKRTNDRTWSYWEKGAGKWEDIVFKTWDSAVFADAESRRVLHLKPYSYKSIRGLDFYKKVFDSISKEENITFINQKVTQIEGKSRFIVVKSESDSYSCDKLFNSIYDKTIVAKQVKYPVLQQHFVGWFVKSKQPAFDAGVATFMDFSVEQKGNTRFMYVLPTSETEALIEYTLFSADLLEKRDYEEAIEDYMQKLGIIDYTIVEKEQGSIPMTCYPFWKKDTVDILHIGTAGGWTKASTGYTFRNADKKSDQLVAFLQKHSDLRSFRKENMFWYYDMLFLDILYRSNQRGSEIFSSLFKKASPGIIFKFLDEETSFVEDLQVILSCPKRLFVSAFFQRIIGRKSLSRHNKSLSVER